MNYIVANKNIVDKIMEHQINTLIDLDFVFMQIGEDSFNVLKNRYNGELYKNLPWEMCKLLMQLKKDR